MIGMGLLDGMLGLRPFGAALAGAGGAAPDAPANLTATAISGSQVDLSWDAVAGATGYKIERATNGVDFTEITDQSGVTYSNTGITGAQNYTYRVIAYNATGDGAASDTALVEYYERILATGDNIVLWRLAETTGTVADNAEGTAARDGAYTGVALDNANFINGDRVGRWDGSADYMAGYSDSLRDVFSGAEGTIGIWVRMAAASVWTDTAFRRFFIFRVNADNRIGIYKDSNAIDHYVNFLYRAGATQEFVQHNVTAITDWFHVAITWNKAQDRAVAYFQGAQVGVTQTGLGTFVGNLTEVFVGADTNTPTLVHNGWLSHIFAANREYTAAEIEGLGGDSGESFFNVNTSGDVTTTRTTLIGEIWSGNGYPATGADSVATGVADPLDTSPSNLDQVDQLTINMDDNDATFVMANTPYIWRPTAGTSINRLAIYHYGHTGGDYEIGGQGDMVRALVEAGYTVCGVMMPAGGVAAHNAYPDPTASLNYLKFFLEPVARSLNQLVGESFDRICMAGISGGGWTTALMPAIDTRIARSVQVAGSFPLYITETSRDWEQWLPGLTELVDYQDLYVMAVTSSRIQKQLLNQDDTCCFTRAQYDAAWRQYEADVVIKATELGGTWSLTWDTTHASHIISAFGRTEILATFDA